MAVAVKGQGSVLSVRDGGTANAFAPIAKLTKIDKTGGKADDQDATTMESEGAYREWAPTLLTAGELSLEGFFVGNQETSQQDLQDRFDNQTIDDYQVVFPPVAGDTTPIGTFTCSGYVSEPPNFAVNVDKLITFTAKIKITGKPTFA